MKNLLKTLGALLRRSLLSLLLLGLILSVTIVTSACGDDESSPIVSVPSPLPTTTAPPPSVSAQVDRMALPALLTVFIPPNPLEPSPPFPALEDSFNAGIPANDQRDFRGEIVNSLQVLYSLNDVLGDDPSDDAAIVEALADILLPDILPFILEQPSGFETLNGRELDDDVIDVELELISEGACTTDFIDNDSFFLSEFPYLGVPN